MTKIVYVRVDRYSKIGPASHVVHESLLVILSFVDPADKIVKGLTAIIRSLVNHIKCNHINACWTEAIILVGLHEMAEIMTARQQSQSVQENLSVISEVFDNLTDPNQSKRTFWSFFGHFANPAEVVSKKLYIWGGTCKAKVNVHVRNGGQDIQDIQKIKGWRR